MEHSTGPSDCSSFRILQIASECPNRNLHSTIYNRLAIRSDADVVILDSIAIVDIRDLHTIAGHHSVDHPAAAHVDTRVADTALSAGGADVEHRVARSQVVH